VFEVKYNKITSVLSVTQQYIYCINGYQFRS